MPTKDLPKHLAGESLDRTTWANACGLDKGLPNPPAWKIASKASVQANDQIVVGLWAVGGKTIPAESKLLKTHCAVMKHIAWHA